MTSLIWSTFKVPEARRRGNGNLLFHGHRLSVWDDEKALELGSNYGCKCHKYLQCCWILHLKMFTMVKSMLCILYKNKNNPPN